MITTLLTLALLAPQETEPLAADLHGALDAWLDQRWDAREADTERLLARLAQADATVQQVEHALRGGRASYPAPPAEPGEVTRLELTCDHVDYDTALFLYIPSGYDAQRSWPLVLVGHGGNSEMSQDRAERTAASYVGHWVATAEKKGLILAAPATGRGWGRIGNSVLFSTISRLSRDLHVDPDRVYATGHSMGGHMTWRCGIGLADRWAAVSPMSGGYDYVANEQVLRLFNVPGYATFGEREPYQIADFNRKIAAYMKDHAYPWTFVEKKGRGHEIFADQLPKVADFFAAHPRDPYRARVWLEGGKTLALAESDPRRPRWPKAHTWNPGRPLLYGTCHWTRLLPLAAESEEHGWNQRAFIERVSASEVHIRSRNVRSLRLYLHARSFDLERPLTLVVNGEKRPPLDLPPPDLRKMLELVREFDDRGRISHGWVDVEIASDAKELPAPSGDVRREFE